MGRTRSIGGVLFASSALLLGGVFVAAPALAAAPNITVNGVAQKSSGNTITLAFGSQAANVSGQDETVTIKSTGTGSANIGVVSLGGTDPQDYRIDKNTCNNAVLNVGATCSFAVRIVATALGSRPAAVIIPDNVPTANQAVIGLSATGAYPGQMGLFETAPSFGQPSTPVGAVKGADGDIWFADSGSNMLVRTDPTGAMTRFPLPGGAISPGPMTAQPGSNLLFFTAMVGGAQRLGKIDTSAVTPTATLLTGLFTGGVHLEGLTADANNVWATDQGTNKIDQYVLATNTINAFTVPTANAGLTGLVIPAFDTANVYFTEFNANKVGKLPIAGGAITEFSTGSSSHPFGIAGGPDNNLWVVLQGKNTVASLDTAFTTLTSHTIPTTASTPTAIIFGNSKLWFFEQAMQKVGTVTFTSATPPVFSSITDASINGDSTALTEEFIPGSPPAALTPDAGAANQIALSGNNNVWVSGSASAVFGPTGFLLVDEQGGTHHATGFPSSVSFGKQAAGTTSNAIPMFVSNVGSFPTGGFVNVSSLTITGANANAFRIMRTNCALLAIPPSPFGSNCYAEVAFSPPAGTAVGTVLNATLTGLTSPAGEITGATMTGTVEAQRPFTPFVLPTANSRPGGVAALNGSVFTAETATNQVASVNPSTGALTEFQPPFALTFLNGGIAAGAGGDSNVVMTGMVGSNPGILVLAPSTNVWLSSLLPDASFSPMVIAAGPTAGRYFLAGQRSDGAAVLWEAAITGSTITWTPHVQQGTFSFAPNDLAYNSSRGTFDFTMNGAIGMWNPTSNTTTIVSLSQFGDFGRPVNIAPYSNGDFFSEPGDGAIGRLDVSGPSPVETRFVVSQQLTGAAPTALTVSGNNVYAVVGSPFFSGAPLDKLLHFPSTATSVTQFVDDSLPQRNTGLTDIVNVPGNTIAISAQNANEIFTTPGG